MAISLTQSTGQVLENRQHERGRFTSPGLRNPDHVFPGKDFRNGSRLDRRRFGVTSFLDGFKDAVVETERSKWHGPPSIAYPGEITPGFFIGRAIFLRDDIITFGLKISARLGNLCGNARNLRPEKESNYGYKKQS